MSVHNQQESAADTIESNRRMMDGRQASIWTALPGQVQSVDLTKLTVSVQPTIMHPVATPDKGVSNVNLPELPDVPIVYPRGGGYSLTFPINGNGVADECLTVFSSRCIDNWWQSGGVQPPFENRMHDLADGFAIMGPYSQAKKISGVSATTVQLRNDSGTIYIEVDDPNKKINLKSNGVEVTLDSTAGNITMVAPNNINLTASGSINITATSAITLTAPTINENP